MLHQTSRHSSYEALQSDLYLISVMQYFGGSAQLNVADNALMCEREPTPELALAFGSISDQLNLAVERRVCSCSHSESQPS